MAMNTQRLRAAFLLAALAMTTSASAVTLARNGVGQALIYPYYTVNKAQDTLVSVTNASDISKAVQVRFLEGYNGRDTLDFVLYLSPHDVWTAAISQTADDGGAILRTSDASCTFPQIPSPGVQLRSAGYDGTGVFPADAGPTSITRTREGSIEFLVGADITPGSPTDIAITHVQNNTPGGGVPPGCATVNDTSALPDEVTPTDGIYGTGTIINVGQGTFFAYNADAIQGFTDIPLFRPTDTIVSLQDANSSDAVAGVARAYVPDELGVPFALDYAFGFDAVSAVFMADTIYNEFIVAASLGANTDWVVTFPTKSFYVDKALYPTNPTTPFERPFIAPGTSDVAVEGTVYDREEGAQRYDACELCPPVAPIPVLSYQVNVVGFRTAGSTDPSGVLGSNLVSLSIPPLGEDGNATMNFNLSNNPHSLPGGLVNLLGAAVGLGGLPVTGFMVYNVINANAQPGLLANYSGAFPHRATVSCQGSAGPQTCTATITGASDSRVTVGHARPAAMMVPSVRRN
jgi:hypothetical protein